MIESKQTHCGKCWICYPANYTGDPEQNNLNNRKAELINTAVERLVTCAQSPSVVSIRLYQMIASTVCKSCRTIGLKHPVMLSCYVTLNMHV